MPKKTLTYHERIKRERRLARQRREALRVTAIVQQREHQDIARMMRDNRAGGF